MKNQNAEIICRCEEITLEEIEQAVDGGCCSVGAVKRFTRAGMGPCQGRGCGKAVADAIARKRGIQKEVLRPDKPRFPTVPVPISALMDIPRADKSAFPRGPGLSDSSSSGFHVNSLEWGPGQEQSSDLPVSCQMPEDRVRSSSPESRKPRKISRGKTRGYPRGKARVVVIGGGYHGCSAAWHLSRAGVETVLVEKKEIGTGASGNNFGCVQLQDSNPGLSFELNRMGFERMKTIGRELESDIDYHPAGSLLYAQTSEEYMELEKLAAEKQMLGIDVRLLKKDEIQHYEPWINTKALLGATYFTQARVDPFKYMYAMLSNGRRHGLEIMENRKVERIETSGGACRGVLFSDGTLLEADWVVIAAGAWTPKLCASLGLRVPVEYIIGESFVTEPLQPVMLTFNSSASFFTTAHGSGGAAASLTATQTPAGNILIGETGEPGPEDPDRAVQLTSDVHCREIPRLLGALFPVLTDVTVLRSWTTCSPSTPDFEPILGVARDGCPEAPEGLIIAAGFKSSVVISSVVGEIVQDLVLKGRTFCDIGSFMHAVRPV